MRRQPDERTVNVRFLFTLLEDSLAAKFSFEKIKAVIFVKTKAVIFEKIKAVISEKNKDLIFIKLLIFGLS